MADYKRMVSYMYQYENGIKRKNVGFARVEAKDGQCKITLHMQLLGQLDSIFPTYLIQRGENNIDLIYLGDTILKNQIMDSRLSADETNIMGTGYQLSEMAGLLLFLNDNVFFATEWDNKPIVANEVLEALRPKNKKGVVQEEAEDKGDIFQATSTETSEDKPLKEKALEDELNMPRYKLPGGWKMVERLQKPVTADASDYAYQIEEPTQNMPEYLAAEYSRGMTTEYSRDMAAEYSRDMTTEYSSNMAAEYSEGITTEQNGNIATEQNPDRNIGTEVLQQESQETSYRNTATEVLQQESQETSDRNTGTGVLQHESQETSDRNIDTEVPQHESQETFKSDNDYIESRKEAAPQCSNGDNDLPEHPIASRFFENYPRIYPFEDNEIILCVKIEPKDIGLLPKEIWQYSNNSFLMHGFYCYHHLIFAKMMNRLGCRYIIGIPGIYHSREQFMAKMFGFESFKSIRKRDLKQGDFGYWYLPVNLDN